MLLMADYKQQILNGLIWESFLNFSILASLNGIHFQVYYYE
jgi:hypothetical protein